MPIWDGTISAGRLGRMLGVPNWRVRELAESVGVRTMNGRFGVADAKKIVRRLVAVGYPQEVEAAKAALLGPLRAEVDPGRIDDRDAA